MDFGIFVEQMRRGTGQADAFREMFELVDAAEAWGLDIVWLAEMLINPARSVLSAPLLVASWIVARTRRLRMGTAVQLLPLNHPLRVAGEVTTLDHLSQGRFDFGIGRSGGTARLRRARRALRGKPGPLLRGAGDHPGGLEGRAVQLPRPVLSVRQRHRHAPPVRQPHPPVRMAATTAETFPRVGRMGLPIFVGLRGMGIPELAGCLRTYRQAWREAGHPGEATRACASRCTPPPPRRPPGRSRARPSPTTSSARPTSPWRRSVGPGPGRSSGARPRPSGCPRSRTTRSSTGRSPSAPAPALIDRLGQLREELGRDRDRRRAESRRALADGAGAAQPRDPHPAGDARVQVGPSAPRGIHALPVGAAARADSGREDLAGSTDPGRAVRRLGARARRAGSRRRLPLDRLVTFQLCGTVIVPRSLS